MRKPAFTMVELVVAVVIIAILSALTVAAVVRLRTRSKLSRITVELGEISVAMNQYYEDNLYQYPPDTTRAVPPGLEKYLAGGTWPKSIWPNGVFDWDNWTVSGAKVYQISYRLCDTTSSPPDPISSCRDPVLFPNFNQYSAIFYCVSGACIPHESSPTAPGYCVNCADKTVNY